MKELNIKDNGILYIPTENKQLGYGLIKGGPNTPYYGGYYIIRFQIPSDYPFKPPECYHVSTSGLRQSPNFHDHTEEKPDTGNGKVCLSRLNTWDGEQAGKDRWTPSMNIRGILNMIRMQVLTKNALDNEPDYQHSIDNPVNARNYEKFVRYQNFRSNVVNIYRKLSNGDCKIPLPIQTQLANVIREDVLGNFQWYLEQLKQPLDNGIYVTCNTYANSSCFCDYDELIVDFKKEFEAAEKPSDDQSP
jgi:ubiquitin-protein ligase